MHRLIRLCAVVSLAAALAPVSLGAHGGRPHPTLFRNGLWYDGRGFARRDVVVADGTIGAAGAAVDTVDLAGGFVVPAFGDAHSHAFSDTARLDAQVRRFVEAGILYVKNPNNPGSAVDSVRARLRALGAPQVAFANGGLTSPGGHPVQIYEGADGAAGRAARRFAGDAYVEVADAAALAAAWPAVLARQPDLIKVYLETSEEHARRRDDSAFIGRRGLDPALLPEVVRRAHAARLPVTAHVASRADFRAAVAAGVDEIAHLPLEPITDDDAAAATRGGVTVVTTSRSHRPTPAGMNLDSLHHANLARLVRAGTRIALGTDADLTVIDEAENLKRIGAFDDAALVRLLAVATPRAVFPGRRVGSLEAGAEATFLVLEGDPTRGLSAVRRIRLRVARGAIVRVAPAAPQRPGVAAQMVPLLMQGDVAGALALYDRLRAAPPDSLSFAEQELNGLGYTLMRHGQAGMAVAIFRKNAEQFPGSANAWDSLADGAMAAGDTATARAAWRSVLERLPGDARLDAARRAGLEQRARAGLAGP